MAPPPGVPCECKSAETKSGSDRAFEWWEGIIRGVVGVATLGTSITFTVVVSDIQDPAKFDTLHPDAVRTVRFPRETIRIFLAIAWLLFVAAMSLATISSFIMSDPALRKEFCDGIDGTNGHDPKIIFHLFRWNTGLFCMDYITRLRLAEIMMDLLMIAAFSFLSLSTAAYVPGVGWAGVALAGLTAFVLLTSLIQLRPRKPGV